MFNTLIIGIVIDVHSIKAAVIQTHNGKNSVKSCHAIYTTQALLSNNYQFNYQEIVKKLQELKSELPILAQKTAMVMADSAVICKEIVMESNLSPLEEEPMVLHYFSLDSPLVIEELSIDFDKENKITSTKSDTTRYFVYATYKNEVVQRVNAMAESRFQLVFLEGEKQMMWALCDMLVNKPVKKPVMIHFGVNSTELICAFEKQPLFKRFLIGTHEIAKQGESQFIHNIVTKIKPHLSSYLLKNSELNQQQIVLIGEIDQSEGLASNVAQALGMMRMPTDISHVASVSRQQNKIQTKGFEQAIAIAIRAAHWMEKKYVT